MDQANLVQLLGLLLSMVNGWCAFGQAVVGLLHDSLSLLLLP